MITQIYETQSPDEARALADTGVDHVGVLVGPGDFPREIGPGRAKEILDAVAGRARRLALTLSSDLESIVALLETVAPDIVHLGMALEPITPADLQALRQRFPGLGLMRTIPVTGESAIALARSYDGVADYLLLDTHLGDDPVIGATGRTHDWSISRRIVEAVGIPVVLAGGLGPDNVADAIRRVRPWGVDSKTRTDHADGSHTKDPDRVARFVRNANAVS